MSEVPRLVADVLAVAGVLGATAGVLGVLRAGDARVRFHAAAAVLVLGVLPLLAACALAAGGAVAARLALVALCLVATAPVAAHVLARLDDLRRRDEGPPPAEQER